MTHETNRVAETHNRMDVLAVKIGGMVAATVAAGFTTESFTHNPGISLVAGLATGATFASGLTGRE